MLIHNFNPVAINFFQLEIRWYSLAYIFGIIFGWFYANKIIRKTKSNNNEDLKLYLDYFDALLPYIIVGIIIGGRLGYVLIYNFQYYQNNYLEILFLWNGGMSFHGGLVGIIISTLIFCNIKKINSFYFLDIISLVSPIGIFFGRIANFINGELIGKETSVPWGIIFSKSENILRHPSQLYEAVLEGIVLFLLLNFFAFKKDKFLKNGFISGVFLILYSIFRFTAEFFREPDIQIGYIFNLISMGQILSLIMLFFGIFIISFRK